MKRLRAVPIALAVSIGLTFGVLTFGACDGGDNEEAEPEPTATVELTGAARELLDLLEQGLNATYRASYETTTPEGDSGGSYVIYNQPPRTRIDTIPAGAAGADSMLIGGDADQQTIGCSGGPNDWECSEIDPLGDSLLRAAGPVAYLTGSDIAGFTVTKTAQPRSIAGQPTTCYELAPISGDTSSGSEYCLTDAGVVLYSKTPSQTVEASEFAPTVADADFTPPAELS